MFKQIFFWAISTLLLGVFTTPAAAQGNSYGHLFAAAGGTAPNGTGTLHFGGGGEGVFSNGAGVGAELGYVHAFRDFTSGVGVFAINGSYHHLKSGSKTTPFITGGYSGFFRDGYSNGINFGGGVNYWFKERTGLRVEFRDHIALGDSEAAHFLGVRVGLTFR